jgi:hypothetical protein
MNYLKNILRTVKQSSPILYAIVLIHFITAILTLFGMFIDDRTIMGINVWIKPLKFLISSGIYILTLGYLITLYPFSKRKKNIINNIVAWTLLFETGIIVYQGARGVQSHYNQSSLFDGLLFAAMGILIAINVLIMVLFIIESLRLKLQTPKAIQWAICLAWVIVLFGSWIGGQMISQMSHNVGVEDGGAGIPLLNWSTLGGDLRVAHFFGLHALQIIPLFAFWVTKKRGMHDRNQIILVTIFALLYASWIGFTFYQASQGVALIKQ